MNPHICAVIVYEDRDIADKANVALPAVVSKLLPLLFECELQHLLDRKFLTGCLLQFFERLLIALTKLRGPATPRISPKALPQYRVVRPVIKPCGVVMAEALKTAFHF